MQARYGKDADRATARDDGNRKAQFAQTPTRVADITLRKGGGHCVGLRLIDPAMEQGSHDVLQSPRRTEPHRDAAGDVVPVNGADKVGRVCDLLTDADCRTVFKAVGYDTE